METLREVMKGTIDSYKGKLGCSGTTVMKLMELDENYKRAIESVENYWLGKANEVLKEIIEEIRNRITNPDTTMQDLVKALDVISTKYSLDLGKPTSIDISLRAIKNLSDEDLNKKIKEIEVHFLPNRHAPQTIIEMGLPTHLITSAPQSKQEDSQNGGVGVKKNK